MSFEAKFLETLQNLGIDTILTNPCARIKEFLKLLDNQRDLDVIQLSREDHGIGIAGGIFLAGKKPVLLIQSTGLGNLLNSLASLTLTYKFPLPIFCSWRGVIDEPISAQKRFGESIEGILKALNVSVHIIKKDDEISIIEEKTIESYREQTVHIFLLSPRLWSKSSLLELKYQPRKLSAFDGRYFAKLYPNPHLTRFQAIREIVNNISDSIALIANIGFPSKELFNIKDRFGNFYMTGSLGQVSAIGLGVSRYTTKHVIVLDGDGSLLMNPGILAMVAQYETSNLSIICLDNGTYGTTGDQPTLSWSGVDLELVARSFGLTKTCKVDSKEGIKQAVQNIHSYQFIHIKIITGNAKVGPISLNNLEIGQRFSNWIQHESISK
ncbi:MAG: sulfopyruvate decarboxylase subunit alpha [Candidatus Hodarchaeales archaeon]